MIADGPIPIDIS